LKLQHDDDDDDVNIVIFVFIAACDDFSQFRASKGLFPLGCYDHSSYTHSVCVCACLCAWI
jgi:hypothetical protein